MVPATERSGRADTCAERLHVAAGFSLRRLKRVAIMTCGDALLSLVPTSVRAYGAKKTIPTPRPSSPRWAQCSTMGEVSSRAVNRSGIAAGSCIEARARAA